MTDDKKNGHTLPDGDNYLPDTAKERKNTSELDVFRRALEDKFNAPKGKGVEKEDHQVRGLIMNDGAGTLLDVRCNQHMAFMLSIVNGRPLDLVVVPIEGLRGFFREDGALAIPGGLPQITLDNSNYNSLAMQAIFTVFSLVSKEVMELEGDDDPFFDLATLSKLHTPKCDLNELVRYYDNIVEAVMKLGGYYLARDPGKTTITLGWKARNAIKNDYLTRQRSILKQMESADKSLHQSLEAFKTTH